MNVAKLSEIAKNFLFHIKGEVVEMKGVKLSNNWYVGLFVADNPFENGLLLVAEKLSVYVLVLLLFVAFIVGFVNEVISGEIEYLMFRLGVPRPSLLILKNVFAGIVFMIFQN